ncbi:MAG: hypothetical protein QG632_823, partial [Candidatus Dependentiae bacterium]|nr:hypothetical protein [Candidatus Dependentiae bacterium]
NFVPFAASAVSASVGAVVSGICIKKIFWGLRQEVQGLRQKLAEDKNNLELQATYKRAVRRLILCGIKLAGALGLTYLGVRGLRTNIPKNELLRNKDSISRQAVDGNAALTEAWTTGAAGNDSVLRDILAEYHQKLGEKTNSEAEKRAKAAAAADKRANPRAGAKVPAKPVEAASMAAPHIERQLKEEYNQKIIQHLIAKGDSRVKGSPQAQKLAIVEREQKLYDQVYKKHYSFWEWMKKSLWSGELPEKEIVADGTEYTLPRDAAALLAE